MPVPTRKTHGPGPTETELVAEFERMEQAGLSDNGKAHASIMAGQMVLAKNIDRLGRYFFGEKWEV
jgi:hypothetical protein